MIFFFFGLYIGPILTRIARLFARIVEEIELYIAHISQRRERNRKEEVPKR